MLLIKLTICHKTGLSITISPAITQPDLSGSISKYLSGIINNRQGSVFFSLIV